MWKHCFIVCTKLDWRKLSLPENNKHIKVQQRQETRRTDSGRAEQHWASRGGKVRGQTGNSVTLEAVIWLCSDSFSQHLHDAPGLEPDWGSTATFSFQVSQDSKPDPKNTNKTEPDHFLILRSDFWKKSACLFQQLSRSPLWEHMPGWRSLTGNNSVVICCLFEFRLFWNRSSAQKMATDPRRGQNLWATTNSFRCVTENVRILSFNIKQHAQSSSVTPTKTHFTTIMKADRSRHTPWKTLSDFRKTARSCRNRPFVRNKISPRVKSHWTSSWSHDSDRLWRRQWRQEVTLALGSVLRPRWKGGHLLPFNVA